MALLSKDQILGAKDSQVHDVYVSEWGGTVRLRSLTGAERDKYEQSLARLDSKGKPVMDVINARARLVALSMIDESGMRTFADTDILALGGKSGKVLDRLFAAARKLSGISEEDFEEMTENFDNAQSESDTSD